MTMANDVLQLGFGTEEMRDMDVKAPRLLPGLAKQRVSEKIFFCLDTEIRLEGQNMVRERCSGHRSRGTSV